MYPASVYDLVVIALNEIGLGGRALLDALARLRKVT
jgi:hypothetical protein